MPFRAQPTFVSPSFKYGDVLVKKINEFQFNLTVSPHNTYPIVDTAGESRGELQGFRITTNRPELVMQVIVYGDSPSPDVINNFTMAELLAMGAGITPGDAETTSTGQSKDPTGQQNGLFPWLARYKDEQLADYLGYEDRRIVLMYTPVIYDQYTRLVVNLINTSTTTAALVQNITVRRLVYQEPLENITPPRVGNRGPYGNVTETEPSPVQSNMDYETDPTPSPQPRILYDEVS